MRRVLHHTLHELGLNVILMLGKMFNFILVLELFYVVTTTTYDFFAIFWYLWGHTSIFRLAVIFLSIWYRIPTEKLTSIHCLLNQGNWELITLPGAWKVSYLFASVSSVLFILFFWGRGGVSGLQDKTVAVVFFKFFFHRFAGFFLFFS